MYQRHNNASVRRIILPAARLWLRLGPLLVGAAVAVAVGLLAQAPARAATNVASRIDLKVLLLGTAATQSDFQDWQAALQREGIPYTAILTKPSHAPITAATLSGTLGDGTPVGYYDAVIVANGALLDCSSGTCASTLAQSEWNAIEQYEQDFSVREISGDVSPGAAPSPGPAYGTGLNAATFTGDLDGVSGSLTASGQGVFPYLKATAPITFGVDGASAGGTTTWGSEASPVSTANFDTLVSGPGGAAMVGIYTHADGVEELEQTYASNQYLLQDQLLRQGVLAWATRGVYLGTQRNYAETEIDDNFLADDVWDTTTHQTDTNPNDAIQETASDIAYAAQWSHANNFRIDMLFNGAGATETTNGASLLSKLRSIDPATGRPYYGSFGWLSHTFDHPNLDQGCASSDYIQAEQNENVNFAKNTLGLSAGSGALGQVDPTVVVTGEHSGLANLVPGTPGTVDPPEFDSVSTSTTSGTLPAGTYTYAVSDQFSPSGGESTASTTQVTLTAPGSVTVSWAAACHASDYKLYRQDASTGAWTLLATVNAGSGDFGPSVGSTTDVTGQGAQPLGYTDDGVAAGSASSGPAASNTATESPYEQNTQLTAAFAALGITAFGADASKPYPDPADTTSGFANGTYTGNQYPAGATFNEPGTNARAVPRYPTNIYYNVATQAQELDEYNTIYASAPAANLAAVLDDVVNYGAGSMFAHLMNNDPRPSFFHQSNLIGAGSALYYSTMTALLGEYNTYFSVPIEQPTLGQAAVLLREQSAWAGDQALSKPTVSAYIQGNQLTVSNTGSSVSDVPITGVPAVGSLYGGSTSGWTAAPAAGASATYTAAIRWPAARVLTLSLAPATVAANGVATSVATVTVSNADGFPISGEVPVLSASDAGVVIGPLADHGNGTYTATITASTTVGAVTLTATDATVAPNVVAAQATLTQTAGAAANVGVQLAPNSVAANGSSTVTATATVSDGSGHPVAGQLVKFTASDPGVKIGAVTDHGNGTYTTTITASQVAGAVTITATDGSVSPNVSGHATLTQVSALDQVVPIVGTGTGTLTVSGDRVPVTLSCPSSQSYCSGKLTLIVASSHLILAQGSFKLAGGSSSTLRLTLSASALAHLGRATSVRVSLTASAVDARGLSGSSNRTTTLYLTANRVAPHVRIASAQLRLSHGAVAIRLGCPRTQSYCDGRVRLGLVVSRQHVSMLGSRRFRVLGGHSVSVQTGVRSSRRALAEIGSGHWLRARITATARNRAGLTGTSTRVVKMWVGR